MSTTLSQNQPLTPITNSLQCEQLCRKMFKKGTLEKYECVYGIYLNRKMIKIHADILNQGNYSETNFNSALLIETALSKNSRNIIITHNHTSGNAKPSQKDIDITKDLITICRFLEINIIDHIIITKDSFYSFSDNHLL